MTLNGGGGKSAPADRREIPKNAAFDSQAIGGPVFLES